MHCYYLSAAFFASAFPESSAAFLAASSFSELLASLVEASVDFEGEATVDFMAERGLTIFDWGASPFAGGAACRLIGKAKRESANVQIIAFFILVLLFIGVEVQQIRIQCANDCLMMITTLI